MVSRGHIICLPRKRAETEGTGGHPRTASGRFRVHHNLGVQGSAGHTVCPVEPSFGLETLAGPASLPFIAKSVCSGRTLALQSVGLGGVNSVWGGAAERSVDLLLLHRPGPSCDQRRDGGTLVTGSLQPLKCTLSRCLCLGLCFELSDRGFAFLSFQDLGMPGRKRKASTSLTDDEGLSLVPFAVPSAGL